MTNKIANQWVTTVLMPVFTHAGLVVTICSLTFGQETVSTNTTHL